MMRLSISDMNEFLQTVNECSGNVNVIYPDGSKVNIRWQDDLQWELKNKHSDNKHCLELTLDVPNPKDYLKIVYFSMGDC